MALGDEIRRLEEGTGLRWDRILAEFENAGGRSLSHAELAAAVHPLVVQTGVDNPDWWGQGATIAYEKHIGRRVTGQSSAGDFQVAASRTVDAGDTGDVVPDLRDHVADAVAASDDIRPVGEPRVSDTPKRSYWRSSLDDGTSFEIAVAPKAKAPERVLVTLTVAGMESAEQRETVRAGLKRILAAL